MSLKIHKHMIGPVFFIEKYARFQYENTWLSCPETVLTFNNVFCGFFKYDFSVQDLVFKHGDTNTCSTLFLLTTAIMTELEHYLTNARQVYNLFQQPRHGLPTPYPRA